MTRSLALFVLLLVGCGGGDVNAVGATVADEIRVVDSSLIAGVVFTPADIVDDAAIDVILRQVATRKEAISVSCDVVRPLVAALTPPDRSPSGLRVGRVDTLGNGLADCPEWRST